MAKNLTDRTIKQLKPKDKPYRVYDITTTGLNLQVSTRGNKTWVFAYRWQEKRRFLKLGTYPATGLAEARRRADESRNEAQRLRQKLCDPAIVRQCEDVHREISRHEQILHDHKDRLGRLASAQSQLQVLGVPRHARLSGSPSTTISRLRDASGASSGQIGWSSTLAVIVQVPTPSRNVAKASSWGPATMGGANGVSTGFSAVKVYIRRSSPESSSATASTV